MYTAHLFDLDGTLVDSAPDITRAANAGLLALGLPSLSVEVVRGLIGDGFPLLVSRALNHAQGRPRDAATPADELAPALEAARAAYMAHPSAGTTLYPNAREVLESLSQRGPLGLVTNKPEAITRALLDDVGLSPFFAVIVGGDTLPTRKPDPAPVHYALSRLGSGGPLLFVGDSANDLHAARAAGLPVALLTHGYSPEEELAALRPEHLLAGLPELLALRAA